MTTLKNMRRRGGHVIVVNPLKEAGLVRFKVPSDPISMIFGSEIASLYLQPTTGGDIAFLTGVAKYLIEENQTDLAFINAYTSGWNEFHDLVQKTSWDEIVTGSGLTKDQIKQAAQMYVNAGNVVFGWCMGITHHMHGVDNVQMIANVAFMRGMIGRKQAGLLPIRGHSNVQGMGSMNVAPKLKDEVFKRLSDLGIKLPTWTGYDTMSCIEAAHEGKLKFAFCLGGNLFGSNPDAKFAKAAFAKMDLVTYLSTTLNLGHVHGLGEETLILPVHARDEEAQKTTQESMFNYVRLSDGGKARHSGLRSEVEIISSLGAKLFGSQGPVDWVAMASHLNIRQLIAKIIPGFEGMATIDKTKKEFAVLDRLVHAPKFNTADGKARFIAHKIPPNEIKENQLQMITIRSEGQFNTVVYEKHDWYRGQERRDVVLMNKADMSRLGIKENQKVCVATETGKMNSILAREFPISQGSVAMYYPEVNQIVGRRVDPKSKTPAFKSVPVVIF